MKKLLTFGCSYTDDKYIELTSKYPQLIDLLKDNDGNIIFDQGGGGGYDRNNKKVIGGGHVWFPIFSSVKSLLETSLRKVL